MNRDVTLRMCHICTEDYPPSSFLSSGGPCRGCAMALSVVRGAGAFRKQEARFLSDDELIDAVQWFWVSNPPPEGANAIYWTRPKLAAIARRYIREMQPRHSTLLERAYKSASRSRQRATSEGATEDEAWHRWQIGFSDAVQRAITEDTWASPALDRYRRGTVDTGGQAANKPNNNQESKGKGSLVTITQVEPGGGHLLADCPDLAACRWHRGKWEAEQRREAQFVAMLLSEHAWNCEKCLARRTLAPLAA